MKTLAPQHLFIIAVLSMQLGCVQMRPNIFQPGDIHHQRVNAMLHDPFPDNDAGPEMVGVRPPGYERQLPEPVRNNWTKDTWWWFN